MPAGQRAALKFGGEAALELAATVGQNGAPGTISVLTIQIVILRE